MRHRTTTVAAVTRSSSTISPSATLRAPAPKNSGGHSAFNTRLTAYQGSHRRCSEPRRALTYQARQPAMAIRTYSTVHTGPNSQDGGDHEGAAARRTARPTRTPSALRSRQRRRPLRRTPPQRRWPRALSVEIASYRLRLVRGPGQRLPSELGIPRLRGCWGARPPEVAQRGSGRSAHRLPSSQDFELGRAHALAKRKSGWGRGRPEDRESWPIGDHRSGAHLAGCGRSSTHRTRGGRVTGPCRTRRGGTPTRRRASSAARRTSRSWGLRAGGCGAAYVRPPLRNHAGPAHVHPRGH